MPKVTGMCANNTATNPATPVGEVSHQSRGVWVHPKSGVGRMELPIPEDFIDGSKDKDRLRS